MSKATKFQNMAAKVVRRFTDGDYVIRNISSEVYNTTSGANVVGHDESPPQPMVSTDIVDDKALGDISSDKHFVITAAGNDISGYEPTIGDIVVTPNGDAHKIAKVKTDLYGAAYEMFVNKEQWLA